MNHIDSMIIQLEQQLVMLRKAKEVEFLRTLSERMSELAPLQRKYEIEVKQYEAVRDNSLKTFSEMHDRFCEQFSSDI